MSDIPQPQVVSSDVASSNVASFDDIPSIAIPEPPSKDEVRLYYYGLPSEPRLVARSNASTLKWQNWSIGRGMVRRDPFWDDPKFEKYLHPVGSHPIVQKWDGCKNQIINILSSLSVDWRAIDVLRVGIRPPDLNDWRLHGLDLPPLNMLGSSPTVLVSVKPDSCSWATGYEAVIQCKGILDRHELTDVHCEIKESKVYQEAGEGAHSVEPTKEQRYFINNA